MYNIIIIGAGQLGSRHLQGVLKSTYALNVTVVDPSEESLNTARERAEKISIKSRLWIQTTRLWA